MGNAPRSASVNPDAFQLGLGAAAMGRLYVRSVERN